MDNDDNNLDDHDGVAVLASMPSGARSYLVIDMYQMLSQSSIFVRAHVVSPVKA